MYSLTDDETPNELWMIAMENMSRIALVVTETESMKELCHRSVDKLPNDGTQHASCNRNEMPIFVTEEGHTHTPNRMRVENEKNLWKILNFFSPKKVIQLLDLAATYQIQSIYLSGDHKISIFHRFDIGGMLLADGKGFRCGGNIVQLKEQYAAALPSGRETTTTSIPVDLVALHNPSEYG